MQKNSGHETKPSTTPEQGIVLLERQIHRATELLKNPPVVLSRYEQWKLVTRNILEKVFGSQSPNVSLVMDIGEYGSFPRDASEDWWEDHRARSLVMQIASLEGLVEVLSLESGAALPNDAETGPVRRDGTDVFVVHGHDMGARARVLEFLGRLGLHAIYLQNEPNEGRTIIEKFLDNARTVCFAVVLLTGDDRGGPKIVPYEKQQLRARQNVILELGYFLGKIGRGAVCALYEPGVEIPSDYQGVLFVELDSYDAWHAKLAKELKAAGLPVDMNKTLWS